MNISAVVLTRNEEHQIAKCLDSLSFCDEIIIIDDNSTDKTVEIAKKMGAKTFSHPLNYDFAKQRNYGLEKARNGWVLFVDADERVGISLKDEIVNAIKDNKHSEYFIPRLDVMWGKPLKHGEMGEIKLLRLAHKKSGIWQGKVHETWVVSGSAGILKNPLLHYPHPTIDAFLAEINFYTDIRAEELFKAGIRSNPFAILVYPKAKFIQNYFFRLGFLDGTAGLVVAIIMSFHSFLVRGKLWLLWNKK